MTRSALSAAALQPGGTIPTTCACCGVLFNARSLQAAYCGTNCRVRAYRYRRQGKPMPGLPVVATARTQPIRPAVLQPEMVDDLPLAWGTAPSVEVREWQGTQIQRRAADGYVNATAMCQANGRRWAKYAEGDRCREYIAALAAVVRNPDFAPIQARRGGVAGGGETWVHPSLAIDLARWISPAFAVWMDGWFLESLANLTPTTHPPQSQLPKGVHVTASTRREAAQLWWDAISGEVMGALTRRLDPATKTDSGLPLQVRYSWHPVY